MPYNEAASSSLAEFVSRNLIVAVLTSNLVIFSYVASRELGRTAEVTASQTAIDGQTQAYRTDLLALAYEASSCKKRHTW